MGSSRFMVGGSALVLVAALGADPALAQGQGGGKQPAQQQGNQHQKGGQELIGHALSMAIESSGLMGAAQQGGYGRAYGPSMGPRGSTGAGNGTSRSDASGAGGQGAAGAGTSAGTEEQSGAGTSAGSGTGTTGSRTTGLAGRESIVSGNRPPNATRSQAGAASGLSSAPAGTATGTSPLAGHDAQDARDRGEAGTQQLRDAGIEGNRFAAVAGSPGMAAYVTTQLQNHARRGFTDSERLFREAAQHAGDANSPTGRYLQAAQNYARTLESFAGFTSAGNGDAGARGNAGGVTSTADQPSVLLVNHAVKEVLDACKLRAMCRIMGNDAQGADILRQHAQQMHDEGMRSIQALASTGDTGTGRGTGVGSGTPAAASNRDNGARAAAGTGGSLLDAATAGANDRGAGRASETGTAGASDRTAAASDRPAGASAGSAGSGAGTSLSGGLSRSDAGAGAQETGSTGTAGSRSGGAAAAGDRMTDSGVGVGGRGRAMIVLAQQAQELVQAIDALESQAR